MVDCDYRLFPFCVLLVVSLYAATSRNYFRFVLINFRGVINRKGPIISENDTDSHQRPPCSFPMFRKYLRQTRTKYLPGDGKWTRRGGKLARFHPDLCSLPYGSWVPRERLARCFARLNVSYIVILGDSNAVRLYKQVRRALSAAGAVRIFNCDDIRHDYNVAVRLALPVRRFLPPTYFRCKITDKRFPVASLLLQYLRVTNDWMPTRALRNSTTTGCVDNNTNECAQTQASAAQVTVYLCGVHHRPLAKRRGI